MLIDMPIRELERYQGRTPCPDDFDDYWARGLRQMEAMGTGYERIPAAFHAPDVECYDLYFTGVGGARIHAKFARPARISTPLPAVLLFHGYAGNAHSWMDKLSYVAAGFIVAALDSRGQGGLSEDVGGVKGTTLHGHIIRGLDNPDPDKLLMRLNFLDTAQLARIVMAMDEVDETRVGATGGSQGGGLTLACAALTPTLNRAAPRVPFLCDYQRVWEMDLAVSAYEELKTYFRNHDPRHLREKEVFTKLGYIDNINLAPRIRAQVLMFTGLMDTICPPSTQFAAFNRIQSKKEVLLYPDYAHEMPPEADDAMLEFMIGMN
jgi:cephalosporin-C deacetylase